MALIGAYVLPTAVGGNADRLGALLAGPIAALRCSPGGSARPRGALLLVLAPLLLYWQVERAGRGLRRGRRPTRP